MQIQTWLKETTDQLKRVNITSARLDATLLLESVLKKRREWLLAHSDQILSSTQLELLNTKVAQRVNRVPLAYIIGSKEFYGNDFFVDENVLIPRPETEILIELLGVAIPLQAKIQKKGRDPRVLGNDDQAEAINTIIDVGTGSGCLAITTKLLYPTLHVTALDISPGSLKVARKNARMHGANVRFIESNLLENMPRMSKTRPYIIMTNLPYVPSNMVTSPDILKEPDLALFSGKDGLSHYREFWQQVGQLKNKPSYVITESLETQHDHLAVAARMAGYELQQTATLGQLFKNLNPSESTGSPDQVRE